MSERAVAFVEVWIAENGATEAFLEDGNDARLEQLAGVAISAAEALGISESEILEEFPDLPSRMAEAVNGAADIELRRQIDSDD